MNVLLMVWIVIALIFCHRFNKWNRITGQKELKEFFRHEITEVKNIFKD